MNIGRVVVAICAFLLASSGVAMAAGEVPTGSGTGFFISADGWLATNAHVLEGCSRVAITGRGDAAEWKSDAVNDLAVVRSNGPPVSPLALRRAPPRLGEDAATLGYPLSQVLSSSVKITTGNISALLGIADDTRYLQISVPVQPGNSGGPLVDRAGAVLGVTSAKLKASSTGDPTVAPENVNFAIRGSVLEAFLQSRGIQYTAIDAAGPPLATADLADKVAPSVVQLICYGKAEETATAPQRPTEPAISVPSRHFQHFDNFDVIGFDYRTVRSVSRSECATACAADGRCRATTYNKRARVCFMKDDAALTIWNQDAAGSIVDELVPNVLPTTFSVHSGKDLTGGDYLHLRPSSFVGCFVACAKDNRCRAFAFIRKKSSCWLKDAIGRAVNQPGVDVGLK
jgi:hypothetical protein